MITILSRNQISVSERYLSSSGYLRLKRLSPPQAVISASSGYLRLKRLSPPQAEITELKPPEADSLTTIRKNFYRSAVRCSFVYGCSLDLTGGKKSFLVNIHTRLDIALRPVSELVTTTRIKILS